LQDYPGFSKPLEALRLHIRPVRAADIGSFLPSEAKPEQIFDGCGGELRSTATRVEIFCAINKRSSCGMDALGGEGERTGMTDM
jgi:hypothetical protein